jgi:hypothetical protein
MTMAVVCAPVGWRGVDSCHFLTKRRAWTWPQEILIGLIVAGLVWAITRFVNRDLTPWYQDTIYDGPRIDGDWSFTLHPDLTPPDQELHLEQYGRRLTGKLTVHRWSDASRADLVLPVTGQIFMQKALIIYSHSASITFGAQLLEIQASAREMDGFGVSVEPDGNRVCEFPRKWVRKST